MNRGILRLATLLTLGLLSGCASRLPLYPAPPDSVERASIKFEYISGFPITVGQVLVYESDAATVSCGTLVRSPQRLFVRARGNPVIEDVNIEGTTLAAKKPVFLAARAITSSIHMCQASGTLVPRAGANYLLRVTQLPGNDGKDVCTLELMELGESQTETRSKDFFLLECPPQK